MVDCGLASKDFRIHGDLKWTVRVCGGLRGSVGWINLYKIKPMIGGDDREQPNKLYAP